MVLCAAVLLFVADAALFRTRWYNRYRDPGSSTGRLEAVIETELTRENWAKVVVVLGDSAMAEGFSARLANFSQAAPGYQFANAAVPGSSPRCWYYMLRDMDRRLHRYSTIVIPVRYYDDRDFGLVDPANQIADVHYLAARLRFYDGPLFAATFHDASFALQAFVEALFKGLTYRQDFQALLDNPQQRMAAIKEKRIDPAWHEYNYPGLDGTLAGLNVNWQDRTFTFPTVLSNRDQQFLRESLFTPLPKPNQADRDYRLLWLGRIVERYRNTATRIVFMRPPIRPLHRPDEPPPAAAGAVRELAKRPGVALLDEHVFDEFERPELFAEARHLNREGAARFTKALVRQIAQDAGVTPGATGR